jgi:flagellar biosynthesis protein FliR
MPFDELLGPFAVAVARYLPICGIAAWGLALPSMRIWSVLWSLALVPWLLLGHPTDWEGQTVSWTCWLNELLWSSFTAMYLVAPFGAFRFAGTLIDGELRRQSLLESDTQSAVVHRLYGMGAATLLFSVDGHLLLFDRLVAWGRAPLVACGAPEVMSQSPAQGVVDLLGDWMMVGATLAGAVLVPALLFVLFLQALPRVAPWLDRALDTRPVAYWGVLGCVLLTLAALMREVPDLFARAVESADALVESRSP